MLMATAEFLRNSLSKTGYVALALIVLVLLSTPAVAFLLPNYLPSHLSQALAIAVGYLYFRRFDLWETYPDPTRRALLVLAFVVPLDNLLLEKFIRKVAMDSNLWLEIFRPEILILIVATFWTAVFRRPDRLSGLFVLAAATGGVSWLLSSAASIDPVYASAAGFFEIAVPLMVFYVYSSNAPDRAFLKHSVLLFCLGFTIIAASQSSYILFTQCCALTSEDFLTGKMDVDVMTAAGGNGYGNTTNFVTLLVAVLPFVAASIYLSDKHRLAKAAILILLTYAGLLVYSRGGLMITTVGLTAVFAIFLYKTGTVRWAIPVALALIILVHVPTGGADYYLSGIDSFFLTDPSTFDELDPRPTAKDIFRKRSDVLHKRFTERSGVSRAEAIRLGTIIAKENWLTGIGTSIYPRIDAAFTSPHSMLILRAAEGGILGLLFFLSLILFIPANVRSWREMDNLATASAISLSCFFLYASVFGGTFSIVGLIPWGFCIALMFACLAQVNAKRFHQAAEEGFVHDVGVVPNDLVRQNPAHPTIRPPHCGAAGELG
jgi:hypothetical protein